ncbi:MAG: ribonuclease P protein component [Vampirovibrionales bacterium]|nr:ribonuclease P protein component [Vampirovibrionales bacterium]
MLSALHRFRDRRRFRQALSLPRVAGNRYFSLCGQARPDLETSAWPQETVAIPLRAVVAQPSVGPTQWAVVVSKKVCRKAVDRNRLRRRLQALLRQHIVVAATREPSPPWQQYGGLVLITRPPAAEATFEELAQGLAQLLQRIRPAATP